MSLAPFVHVLRLPRVRPLMLLMLFARIPPTAAGVTLTLHVAVTLDRGYGAAGLVGAAVTIGIGLGSPILGRLIDSRGLRTTLVLSVVCESAFWLVAPSLSFEALLAAAFFGGLMCVPAMSIGRQVLSALVPADQQRTAFSLDSISVEFSYMAGPALGVLVATKVSTSAALIAVGVSLLVAGTVMYVVNPPMVSEHEDTSGVRPGKREWVTGPLLATLVVGAGAVLMLSGMEVSLIASLERAGQSTWIGVVFIVMCVASALGGLVYGSARRVPGQITMMVTLGVLTLPVGIGDGNWVLLALALIPMNFMCAPTLASTSEKITALVPASVRGEAMGLQGSAFTLGAAAGAPLAGFAVDHGGPPMGFVAAGLGGLLIAGVAFGLQRWSQPRTQQAESGVASGGK